MRSLKRLDLNLTFYWFHGRTKTELNQSPSWFCTMILEKLSSLFDWWARKAIQPLKLKGPPVAGLCFPSQRVRTSLIVPIHNSGSPFKLRSSPWFYDRPLSALNTYATSGSKGVGCKIFETGLSRTTFQHQGRRTRWLWQNGRQTTFFMAGMMMRCELPKIGETSSR